MIQDAFPLPATICSGRRVGAQNDATFKNGSVGHALDSPLRRFSNVTRM